MFAFFDSITNTFVGFTSALALALLAVIAVLVIVRRIAGRKQIIFDPWADLRPQPDETLGRSIGEMVLHRLRAIQWVHERSMERMEIANTYRDIPAFAQGLDPDIELLGSVELGSTPGVVTALLVFVLRAFPFLSPRTRLRGSIHQHSERRRLQAALENFRHPATGVRCTRMWEVVVDDGEDASLPQAVEELAYRMYLDLLYDDTFKSWECFRAFTRGLGHHIDHMDLGREDDRDQAEAHYREALAMEPSNPAVNYNLGVLVYMRYASSRSNDEALGLFRAALTAPNDGLRARANSGMANAYLTRVHRFRGGGRADLKEALVLATQAVALQPQLDAAAKACGYAHHQLGEWLFAHAADEPDPALARRQSLVHRRQARRGYERALKLNPRHFVAANNLANLLLEWALVTERSGEREQLLTAAADAAERSLRVSPGYHHAHDNLGNIRLTRGDSLGALQAFEAALRFQPTYPEARNDIAVLCLDARYSEAAVSEARRHHLAALALTTPDSDRQRHKLCRQFTDRARSLRTEGHLVGPLAASLGGDPACSCQQSWEAGNQARAVSEES